MINKISNKILIIIKIILSITTTTTTIIIIIIVFKLIFKNKTIIIKIKNKIIRICKHYLWLKMKMLIKRKKIKKKVIKKKHFFLKKIMHLKINEILFNKYIYSISTIKILFYRNKNINK
jgi:hypothetical protein